MASAAFVPEERLAAREPRSLFELDDRLIELMDRAEEAVESVGFVPDELTQEINDYIDAWRSKVDRIAGYWRWQESIAAICGKEAERLAARRKAAESRVARLRSMLLAFMTSRGVRKLEGERASIGMQANSTATLVIDDPLRVADCFFQQSVPFTKTELQETVFQLPEGDVRRRLESVLLSDRWEINSAAVRAEFESNRPVDGARMVKGYHVRSR